MIFCDDSFTFKGGARPNSMKIAAPWFQNCAFSCSHTRAKSPYHHRPAPGLPPTAATVPAAAARWATVTGAARLSSAMRISTSSPVTQPCPDKKSTRGTHTSSRDIRTEKLPRRNSDRWCRWGRLTKNHSSKKHSMKAGSNVFSPQYFCKVHKMLCLSRCAIPRLTPTSWKSIYSECTMQMGTVSSTLGSLCWSSTFYRREPPRKTSNKSSGSLT